MNPTTKLNNKSKCFYQKPKIAIRETIINYIDKSRKNQNTIDVFWVALAVLSLHVSTSRARYEPLRVKPDIFITQPPIPLLLAREGGTNVEDSPLERGMSICLSLYLESKR